MSLIARRELLVQVAPRYQGANRKEKEVILEEFIASTGYERKHGIHLLNAPIILVPKDMERHREPRYGGEVEKVLLTCWSAANYICAKRLVPFLPDLVSALERHGHLRLSDRTREQLLSLSAATAERIFKRIRGKEWRGRRNRSGQTSLKRRVPIRTFGDWDEVGPGYLEADLVAHCGTVNEGSYLHTVVMTDVRTAWTECLPVLNRGQEEVLRVLGYLRGLLPFPLRGLHTDNGGEFLNELLFEYCAREGIVFTRGRAYRKNDQCHVEQKNGDVVRQLVGYDRYEGEMAYRQLMELYRVIRVYVNFYQPSMKLISRERIYLDPQHKASKLVKKHDLSRTPYQRVIASDVLSEEKRNQMDRVYHALDPIELLSQLEKLQDAFWRHATTYKPRKPPILVVREGEAKPPDTPSSLASAASPENAGPAVATEGTGRQSEAVANQREAIERRIRRKYRLRKKDRPLQHTWRTRADPFETVWTQVESWLLAAPERTGKSLFQQLQQEHPGTFSDGQLRSLQRRVKEWRRRRLTEFDTGWLDKELQAFASLEPERELAGCFATVRETPGT